MGFDLYTQMMDEAVRELRGVAASEEIEPDVELPLAALIPEEYVPEVTQRLVFYKRFAKAQSDDELYDIGRDAGPVRRGAAGSGRARRGDGPEEPAARDADAGPEERARALDRQLGPDALLAPERLATLVARGKGRYRLTPGMELVESLPAQEFSAARAMNGPSDAERASEGQALLDAARRLLSELAQLHDNP